jgi:hypothetical protein
LEGTPSAVLGTHCHFWILVRDSRGLWHVCSTAMTRVESDVPVRRCLATSARADSVGLAAARRGGC